MCVTVTPLLDIILFFLRFIYRSPWQHPEGCVLVKQRLRVIISQKARASIKHDFAPRNTTGLASCLNFQKEPFNFFIFFLLEEKGGWRERSIHSVFWKVLEDDLLAKNNLMVRSYHLSVGHQATASGSEREDERERKREAAIWSSEKRRTNSIRVWGCRD